MTDQKQPMRVDISRVIPIFADEAMIISRIKAKKGDEKNGKQSVNKEGLIEFVFLDPLTQPPRAVSRIVMSRSSAEGLHKVLGDNLEKLGVELKSKKMPKQPKPKVEKKQEKGYFG